VNQQDERDYEEERYNRFLLDSEGYCDLCEVEGHTFRTCPRRDDE
jgi:hypothetical protein